MLVAALTVPPPMDGHLAWRGRAAQCPSVALQQLPLGHEPYSNAACATATPRYPAGPMPPGLPPAQVVPMLGAVALQR